VLVKWPLRAKLFVGLGLLLAMVAILSSSGLYSAYAYRTLVKTLSWRVSELPLAAEMSARVADMRVTLAELRELSGGRPSDDGTCKGDSPLFADPKIETVPSAKIETGPRTQAIRRQFREQLDDVADTLADYSSLLEEKHKAAGSIGDNQPERQAVQRIEAALDKIRQVSSDDAWMNNDATLIDLDRRVIDLQTMAVDLPTHLHSTLKGFAVEVRGQYHLLLVGLWITSALATIVFAVFMRLFYRWIFSPLDVLIRGSRKVAGGDFNYRLRLETHDEMSELAAAMNDMTHRFRTIRDDLDRQVQQRTKQVVRNEQLASVGFLAAGVAHEINNPLASIAICAESLEGRIRELLGDKPGDQQGAVIADYLRMIQSEAFRCKGITEKLLDFSRIGPPKRQPTDLRELVQGVLDVIGHLGKYHGKQIVLCDGPAVLAPVNGQELKQVVLNLLTNALDSLEDGGSKGDSPIFADTKIGTVPDGRVEIRLETRDAMAELSVADNGCGMDDEVLERIFEPFFTRRRAGQGTGLGLSICYRIVSDHGGTIEARSAGPGQGATFIVRLPLTAAGDSGIRKAA
jgi:signal transduction histidine kinase